MLDTPPALTIRRTFHRPPRDAVAKLEGALTGQVADALGGLGALDAAIKPIAGAPPSMQSFVGPAFPCMNSPADQLALVGALAYAEPGDVLVVGTEAYLGTAVIGDLMAGMLLNSGAAALVTDGAVRDTNTLKGYGFPVYSANATAKQGPAEFWPWQVNDCIQCGGVLVRPGDAIVGDDDGVVVVPAAAAEEVIQIAHQREEVEAVIKAQLEIEQCSPGKYYPFNENTWKLFEEKTGKKPYR